MAKMAKTGLGKGLAALIGTRPAPVPQEVDPGESVHHVRLATIVPSPLQPRKNFAPEALQELVDSIRQHGIIQPLIVRRIDGRHELIAGERRWRAAQEVGLSDVPVIVRTASDILGAGRGGRAGLRKSRSRPRRSLIYRTNCVNTWARMSRFITG